MPIYTYMCSGCGPKEIRQQMLDSSLEACPECGGKDFRKTYQSIGLAFKGPGFYSTDK